MLMPKKVKFRKQQRGRMKGKAWRGSDLSFGDFGLKVMECGYITDRQIEATAGRMLCDIRLDIDVLHVNRRCAERPDEIAMRAAIGRKDLRTE